MEFKDEELFLIRKVKLSAVPLEDSFEMGPEIEGLKVVSDSMREMLEELKGLLDSQQLSNLTGLLIQFEKEMGELGKDELIMKLVEHLPVHLKELFKGSCKNINGSELVVHAWLLGEFAETFAKDDLDLGCYKGLKHEIETGNSPPVKKRYRRTAAAFQSEEEAHLKKMLEIGVIQASTSDWSFPPVLVRKKDGSLRWCLDYRDLNAVTRKDNFGIPNISECTDFLSDFMYLSSVDMASGYWKIEIEERDRHKTAFLTKYGLFEHKRMAFGLTNAPASFQRVISLVLSGMLWHEVLAYIDDVIIKGKSFVDHVRNLFKTFTRFRQNNLKLKPKKCHFFEHETLFLGHMITPQGVKINPSNVEKVEKWPTPKKVKDVESFLGFANYHRSHIKDYAQITQPLYMLTGPRTKFIWGEIHEVAFREIKKLLITAPMLAFPDLSETAQWVLDCDASDSAIGGVLSQVVEKEERVVCYGSFVMTPCQRKYCTTRKELLSIIRFTRQYRHY